MRGDITAIPTTRYRGGVKSRYVMHAPADAKALAAVYGDDVVRSIVEEVRSGGVFARSAVRDAVRSAQDRLMAEWAAVYAAAAAAGIVE